MYNMYEVLWLAEARQRELLLVPTWLADVQLLNSVRQWHKADMALHECVDAVLWVTSTDLLRDDMVCALLQSQAVRCLVVIYLQIGGKTWLYVL